MELITKKMHMLERKCQAVSQITFDEDMNVPDVKPDMGRMIQKKGNIQIEDIQITEGKAYITGALQVFLLYVSDSEERNIESLMGNLPLGENLNLEGLENGDKVQLKWEIEDLSVHFINSRKLNVQSVVTLNAGVEEIYDEEAPIGIHGEDTIEYRKMPMNIAQIAISKNDIFRVKEEISLPSNYPNIFQILWNNISLGDVEFKVMEEKLTIQGDIHFFILYEGEGEDHPVRSFETTLPFSGTLECHGCREGMLPDIRYSLGQQELTIRPDFDGEERNIGLDLVLDISIRIYEEEKIELVSDIYGVTNEVDTATRSANLRRLLSKVTGKTKVTDHIRAAQPGAPILQLLHSEGMASLDQQSVIENGIVLKGSLLVKVMYITGDDEAPYGSTQAQIPYQYTLEVPEIAPEDMSKVHAEVEQLQVTMLDGEEMDVKAVLAFATTVFKNIPVELISQVSVSDLDSARMSSLPGMVIYMVKEGDNLWNIGKKYYVPVDSLREWNELSSDELVPGQKLLIVKGG